ncbi:hypothetical protein ANAEL_03707 [Anaerolineales bacterium]|nr:hypothetical protein ANAEL_03707 [Anaerolineales bacterium]
MEYGIDLLLNIAANIIFWLGLGLFVRYAIINRSRARFLKFFGFTNDKSLVVYLSNLWVPKYKEKPWGRVLSGHEFDVTRTVNNLFGSAPLNLPELVRGLIDNFWLDKKPEVSVQVSPLNDKLDLSCNMIVVGSALKNSVRRYFASRNLLYVTITNEPNEPPEDIFTNLLEPSFTVMRGKLKGEIVKRQGQYNVAVIEKVYNDETLSTVFLCAGLRGDSSWVATEYLARNWRGLYSKFGTKDFVRCLWYPYTDEPMKDYKEPTHVRDFP